MQTGKNVGMITMDGSLQNLLASKTIAPEDAEAERLESLVESARSTRLLTRKAAP